MNETMNTKSVFDYFEGTSKQETGVSVFMNNELGLQMRTILNEDNSISVNAEDTAIGFGWVDNQRKKGKTYQVIRWARINEYCRSFGFLPRVAENDYIPESLFYRLGMKANNERAEKFQNWLAMDVIPSIRKTGTYSTKKTTLSVEERFRLAELLNNTPPENRPYIMALFEDVGVKFSQHVGKTDFANKLAKESQQFHATPRGRMEYTKKYADMNGVGDFLKTFNPINRPSAEVHEEYSEWCKEQGIEPTSKIMFSKVVNQYLGTAITLMKIKGQVKRVFVEGGV